MTIQSESRAKLGPLGREFRGVRVASIYNRDLLWQAFKGSLVKFDPRIQIHNPVMFVVWVGMLVTLVLTIDPNIFGPSNASRLYNGVVTTILALTVWFANFAEALAEGRGKAKAESLRQTRSNLTGVRVREDGSHETAPTTALRMVNFVRRLLPLGRLHELDHPIEEAVAWVHGHANEEPIRNDGGSSRHGRKHVRAGLLQDGSRLACDGGLVDIGDALDDLAIRRDEVRPFPPARDRPSAMPSREPSHGCRHREPVRR